MSKKQFKAESKRVLDLMVNSIYTNKEIFLRELISNASDAIDKLYYRSLTKKDVSLNQSSLEINLKLDKENRNIIITDNGCGMTGKELEDNLGTIARSGSLAFKNENEKKEDIDIIGQFGVGFYSAFMVADKITVESRSLNSDKAYKWESTGEDGYTISEIERDKIGTKITLHIKDDTDDEKYSEYLEESKIENLVKKYSDYVRYPIQMEVEKAIPDPTDDKKTITTTEMETLNSMIPLWKKHPSQITKEDYNEFYKAKFNDWQDPLKVIHYSVEGNISYTALLFIPATLPYNFYNTDFEGGLQLYSKGVFIMDKAKELLPESYRFVTGLIDSEDLSLNISREILQQDRQVKALAKSIEKKIHGALIDMMKDDRENYEKFFRQFGKNIKYDIYKSYGMNADKLKDLLMYESSKEDKYVSLSEYVSRMSENQKDIYYACGTSVSEIKKLPVFDKLMDKGYEVLYFTDPVDEFSITMMHQFEEHEFKNITNSDLDLDSDEEKKEREEKTEENKDMLALMKEALGDNVKDVRISSRLKDDPVCLVADAGMSLEMEKILSQDPANSGMKASKILEINADHPIFATLEKLFKENPDTVKEYASVLYDQALLIQGLEIKDPVEYAKKITSLMIQAAK